jgi:hypothetical protein
MKLSKREPKHMGEVMSDIAERYDKLTKTKMSAKEKYERETGDKEPDDQISYGEWYERYVRWLEKQVEKQR